MRIVKIVAVFVVLLAQFSGAAILPWEDKFFDLRVRPPHILNSSIFSLLPSSPSLSAEDNKQIYSEAEGFRKKWGRSPLGWGSFSPEIPSINLEERLANDLIDAKSHKSYTKEKKIRGVPVTYHFTLVQTKDGQYRLYSDISSKRHGTQEVSSARSKTSFIVSEEEIDNQEFRRKFAECDLQRLLNSEEKI